MRWKLPGVANEQDGAGRIADISKAWLANCISKPVRIELNRSEMERVKKRNTSQERDAMHKPVQNTAEPAVNFAELLERVENDRELLQDLVAIFKQDFPRHLRSLKEGVARREMKQVQSTGHTLKGMLANLAMTRASAAAAHLEQLGRSEESAGLEDALALFEQEAASLLPELDAYLAEARR